MTKLVINLNDIDTISKIVSDAFADKANLYKVPGPLTDWVLEYWHSLDGMREGEFILNDLVPQMQSMAKGIKAEFAEKLSEFLEKIPEIANKQLEYVPSCIAEISDDEREKRSEWNNWIPVAMSMIDKAESIEKKIESLLVKGENLKLKKFKKIPTLAEIREILVNMRMAELNESYMDKVPGILRKKVKESRCLIDMENVPFGSGKSELIDESDTWAEVLQNRGYGWGTERGECYEIDLAECERLRGEYMDRESDRACLELENKHKQKKVRRQLRRHLRKFDIDGLELV